MGMSLPVMGVPGLLDGGGNAVTFSAITTAPAQTVTLQRITPTGADITVYWGDGNTSTITNGNAGTTTHQYAAAGTYAIRISNPSVISYLDLRDSRIVFNSATLLNCGDTLTDLYLSGLGAGCTINSADMAHLALSSKLYLYFPQAGTYAIDSADFAAYTLSSQLLLVFPQAGTYAIDSADFAAYTLSSQLYLHFPQAGTYAIDSADFAAYTLSSQLYLVFHSVSTTATIAQADFDGFPNLPTVQIEMGLTQAQVDAVLLGFYDGFATKAVSNGTIDLLGGSNAAPSGVSPGSAECPPTTGYNAAYELVNDSCGVSSKHWASVTVA